MKTKQIRTYMSADRQKRLRLCAPHNTQRIKESRLGPSPYPLWQGPHEGICDICKDSISEDISSDT